MGLCSQAPRNTCLSHDCKDCKRIQAPNTSFSWLSTLVLIDKMESVMLH